MAWKSYLGFLGLRFPTWELGVLTATSRDHDEDSEGRHSEGEGPRDTPYHRLPAPPLSPPTPTSEEVTESYASHRLNEPTSRSVYYQNTV